MSGYTKGEWRIEENGFNAIIYSANNKNIAQCYHTHEANACLIAEAPKLLAACEAALEFIGRSNKTDWDNEITPVLRATIAEAKGD